MATVMLVHGAWHGAWCWHKVVAGLEARGVAVQAVTLPLTGLDADAVMARSVLDAIDDDVVLCGHSYGGQVISRMTSPSVPTSNVKHLVYLCAFMAPEDVDAVALFTEHGSDLPAALRVTDAGLEISDEALVHVLYGDCSDEDIALVRRSLRPMPLGEAPPLMTPGYTQHESTYVVCTQDRSIPEDAQRVMAAAAHHVVSFPTSHSPFFSAPELLVDLLAGLAS